MQSHDTIDAVMQAAERLRHALDATCVDLENMPVEAEVDLLRLARFALSILPKGKRPEPVEVSGLDLKAKVWMPCEGNDSLMWGEVTTVRNRKVAHFSSDESVRSHAFHSEDDAWLAAHWGTLDSLIEGFAFAS